MFEKLNTAERWLFNILSLVLVIFYSYSAVLVPAATQYHRGIYVVITYVLVFLLYRSRSVPGRIADYFLMAA
ncbi:MAG: TRAP transporter permease, partial [Deltaproteobacteria bacterium]|nr:TRAP transporter permease [Deltaproteobacteria bacterium]